MEMEGNRLGSLMEKPTGGGQTSRPETGPYGLARAISFSNKPFSNPKIGTEIQEGVMVVCRPHSGGSAKGGRDSRTLAPNEAGGAGGRAIQSGKARHGWPLRRTPRPSSSTVGTVWRARGWGLAAGPSSGGGGCWAGPRSGRGRWETPANRRYLGDVMHRPLKCRWMMVIDGFQYQ